MEKKNNFLLPNRLDAVVAKLSDKQAGVLFKGILAYANKGTLTEFDDGMVAVVFEMARQEIDYNTKQYNRTCEINAMNGKLGGAPKGNTNAKKQAVGCFSTENKRSVEIQPKTSENNRKQAKTTENNPNDMSCYDVDVDMSNNKLLTAPKAADTPQNKPKQLNQLQVFAEEVIKNFEPDVQTKDQKSIWYKRNCRCLSDIFRFCGKNIPLAIKTIDTCLERMAKAGYSCGYEAVCRNLPEYMAVAKQKMEGTYAKAQ